MSLLEMATEAEKPDRESVPGEDADSITPDQDGGSLLAFLQETSGDLLTCENCGNMFPYAGRGRRPKNCNECRGPGSGSKKTSGGAKEKADIPPAGRQTPQLKRLEKSLNASWMAMALLVGNLNPVDGKILATGGPNFVGALIELAEGDPAFRKMLLDFTKASGYGTLFMAAGAMAVPIAANHGLIGPKRAEKLAMREAARKARMKAQNRPPVPEDATINVVPEPTPTPAPDTQNMTDARMHFGGI